MNFEIGSLDGLNLIGNGWIMMIVIIIMDVFIIKIIKIEIGNWWFGNRLYYMNVIGIGSSSKSCGN